MKSCSNILLHYFLSFLARLRVSIRVILVSFSITRRKADMLIRILSFTIRITPVLLVLLLPISLFDKSRDLKDYRAGYNKNRGAE